MIVTEKTLLIELREDIRKQLSTQVIPQKLPVKIDSKYRFFLQQKLWNGRKYGMNDYYDNSHYQSEIQTIKFIEKHLCSRGFVGTIVELGCGDQSYLDYDSIIRNDDVDIDQIILNDICWESVDRNQQSLVERGLSECAMLVPHVSDFSKPSSLESIINRIQSEAIFIMNGGTFGNMDELIRKQIIQFVIKNKCIFAFSFAFWSNYSVNDYESRKYFHFLPLKWAGHIIEDFDFFYRFDPQEQCIIGEAMRKSKSVHGVIEVPVGTRVEIFRSQKFDEDSVRYLVNTKVHGAQLGHIYKSNKAGIAVIEPSDVKWQ